MNNVSLYRSRFRLTGLLWLLIVSPMLAQSISVSGRVTDESGQALPGVSVLLKSTTTGTVTSAEGTYRLSVPVPNSTLVFSYVGYLPQEIALNGRNTIDLQLAVDAKSLGEVVVVGYGTQQRKDLTGSVTSVQGKDLQQVPSVNAIQSLQGLVSGVDIVATNNAPGASPQIRIRGNRSINATNEPLLVVDGLPFSGSLNDLNSADIKSMEILKDASATAIYGSRGANGVVLITTKRGIAGKIQISYNGYYGVQTPLRQLNLMNGAQFAQFRREARRNVNRYASAVPDRALDETMFYFRDAATEQSVLQAYDQNGVYNPANVRDFDWVGAVSQQGSIQDHQVSILAGSEKTQTSFSVGYFNNQGVVKNLGYDRWNLRLTIDNQLNRVLKIGGTAATSINGRDSTANLYELAGSVNPLSPIRDMDGILIQPPGADPLTRNPVVALEGQFHQARATRFYGNFFLEAGLLDGLKYRVSFSPDYRSSRTGAFASSLNNLGSPSSASYSTNQRFHYVLDNLLIYDKVINTSHKIGVTLLQSLERDRFESVSGSVQDLPYDTQLFYRLSTANTVNSLNSDLQEWSLSSVMGRVNYGFKSKYLLTLTGRYDGSSRLAKGNKWSFFPSAALAWNASEESFIRNLAVFSDLKVRTSYGVTGNTAIDPYQTLGGLSRTSYATDNNPAYGFQPNLIANPNLGWEKTKQVNVGVDFGVLNDRITGTVDLYQQNTVDLLLARQLPTASGFSSVVQNVGATRNRGMEVSLRGVVIDNRTTGLRWSHQLVFYTNKEEITELYNGKVDDIGNRWFIGNPITTYFDYKKTGLFQDTQADKELIATYNAKGGTFAPGLIKVQDTNGDGAINALDRVIQGSSVPAWTGSVNTSVEFKGLDLTFLIFARRGQTINEGNSIRYEGRNNWLNVDYWTPANPTNAYPKPVDGRTAPDYASTLAYQDGSFVRVRNVTLGYTLPQAVQSRLKTSQFRVYVSALNPLLVTKFQGLDPEGSTGITLPSVTTYMTGLNITF